LDWAKYGFSGWVDTVNHKLNFKQEKFQSFGQKISKIHNSHMPTSEEEEEECSSPQQPCHNSHNHKKK